MFVAHQCTADHHRLLEVVPTVHLLALEKNNKNQNYVKFATKHTSAVNKPVHGLVPIQREQGFLTPRQTRITMPTVTTC